LRQLDALCSPLILSLFALLVNFPLLSILPLACLFSTSLRVAAFALKPSTVCLLLLGAGFCGYGCSSDSASRRLAGSCLLDFSTCAASPAAVSPLNPPSYDHDPHPSQLPLLLGWPGGTRHLCFSLSSNEATCEMQHVGRLAFLLK
jgi:hypothetical protein